MEYFLRYEKQYDVLIQVWRKIPTTQIDITLDKELLKEIDQLVSKKIFQNRSKAIQEAVKDKISRMRKSRLARECAKLEPESEQAMAEEGMSLEVDE